MSFRDLKHNFRSFHNVDKPDTLLNEFSYSLWPSMKKNMVKGPQSDYHKIFSSSEKTKFVEPNSFQVGWNSIKTGAFPNEQSDFHEDNPPIGYDDHDQPESFSSQEYPAGPSSPSSRPSSSENHYHSDETDDYSNSPHVPDIQYDDYGDTDHGYHHHNSYENFEESDSESDSKHSIFPSKTDLSQADQSKFSSSDGLES